MNLKQLKYFQDIVRLHSFTEAAEENYISQSAISQQMKNLEAELGVAIFERKNRDFSLTQAGQFFYQGGKDLVKGADALVTRTQAFKDQRPIRLQLGIVWGLAHPGIYKALQAFRETFPHVELAVTVGSHEELGNLLRGEKLDLVINDQRKAFSSQYANERFARLPLYLRLAPQHPLANREHLSAEDIAQERLLLLAKPGQEKEEATFYQGNLGFGNDFAYAASLEEAHYLLAQGDCLKPFEKGPTANDFFVELPFVTASGPLVRDFYLFYPLSPMPPYAENFLAFLREFVGD